MGSGGGLNHLVRQAVVQSGEHLVLHGRQLISLLSQIFRLVAGDMAEARGLRNAGQLRRNSLRDGGHSGFIPFEHIAWPEWNLGIDGKYARNNALGAPGGMARALSSGGGSNFVFVLTFGGDWAVAASGIIAGKNTLTTIDLSFMNLLLLEQ